MPTKPKLEILSQDKFRGTNRSPDLVVCCSLIGLNLIYPNLTYFRIFYWFLHMCTDNSRGCRLVCMMSQTYASPRIYKSINSAIQKDVQPKNTAFPGHSRSVIVHLRPVFQFLDMQCTSLPTTVGMIAWAHLTFIHA